MGIELLWFRCGRSRAGLSREVGIGSGRGAALQYDLVNDLNSTDRVSGPLVLSTNAPHSEPSPQRRVAVLRGPPAQSGLPQSASFPPVSRPEQNAPLRESAERRSRSTPAFFLYIFCDRTLIDRLSAFGRVRG